MNERYIPVLDVRITKIIPENVEYVNEDCPDQGVALVVVNSRGEFLLGRETVADDWFGRREGQWNILTETRKIGENFGQTMRRALSEELGVGCISALRIIAGSYRETNEEYPEALGYDYRYRCLAMEYRGADGPASSVFRSPSGEISDHMWIPYEKLDEYDIELGARLVIEYYAREVLGPLTRSAAQDECYRSIVFAGYRHPGAEYPF